MRNSRGKLKKFAGKDAVRRPETPFPAADGGLNARVGRDPTAMAPSDRWEDNELRLHTQSRGGWRQNEELCAPGSRAGTRSRSHIIT